MRRLAIAALLATVSGCASYDPGQIDYRVAQPPSRVTQAQVELYMNGCASDDARCSSASPPPLCVVDRQDPNAVRHCDPLTPGRLVRRYQPDAVPGADGVRPFRENDVYSIELSQGVIGDSISESIFTGGLGSSAEIVILANVFEFSAGGDGVEQARFLDATEFPISSNAAPAAGTISDQLKVVYYSPGVHRRQPLNFSNIPIVARTQYHGRSVGVQIVIIELDTTAGSVDSLLKTLSDFGQTSNLIPVSPGVQNVLLGLGTSLLRAQAQDDIIFEYRFVLSPAVDQASPNHAVFEPGRYVLRRTQSHGRQMDWRNLYLDHNTGRLFIRRFPGDAPEEGVSRYEEFRGDTYLTLNIRQYPRETGLEDYRRRSMADLRREVEAAAEVTARPLAALNTEVTQRLGDARSTSWLERLTSKWTEAERALIDYRVAYAVSPDAGCPITPEHSRIQGLARIDAQRALSEFIQTYQTALAQPVRPGTGDPEFGSGDRARLVGQVSRYFAPLDTTEETNFAAAGSFQSAYLGGSGEALVALALGRITDHPQMADCAALVERGWAVRTGG